MVFLLQSRKKFEACKEGLGNNQDIERNHIGSIQSKVICKNRGGELKRKANDHRMTDRMMKPGVERLRIYKPIFGRNPKYDTICYMVPLII